MLNRLKPQARWLSGCLYLPEKKKQTNASRTDRQTLWKEERMKEREVYFQSERLKVASKNLFAFWNCFGLVCMKC